MRISFKTGQKILEYLASISTPAHAKRIRERNEEALDTGKSEVCCPHCTIPHACGRCLWTHAIRHITKRKIERICSSVYSCPCIFVPFTEEDFFTTSASFIPEAIELRTDLLELDDYGDIDARNWLQAHVDWTKNFKWGTRTPPKKYRTAILS